MLLYNKDQEVVFLKGREGSIDQITKKEFKVNKISYLIPGCAVFFDNCESPVGKYQLLCNSSPKINEETKDNHLGKKRLSIILARGTDALIFDEEEYDTSSPEIKPIKLSYTNSESDRSKCLREVQFAAGKPVADNFSSISINDDIDGRNKEYFYDTGNKYGNFFMGLISGILEDNKKGGKRDSLLKCINKVIEPFGLEIEKSKPPELEGEIEYDNAIEEFGAVNEKYYKSIFYKSKSLFIKFIDLYCTVKNKVIGLFKPLNQIVGIGTIHIKK